MGRLKNRRVGLAETEESPERTVYDLSGVIFERAPRRPRTSLNLTRLQHTDAATARCVWECLKRRRPALAALLTDPGLQALKKTFDAEISIELD